MPVRRRRESEGRDRELVPQFSYNRCEPSHVRGRPKRRKLYAVRPTHRFMRERAQPQGKRAHDVDTWEVPRSVRSTAPRALGLAHKSTPAAPRPSGEANAGAGGGRETARRRGRSAATTHISAAAPHGLSAASSAAAPAASPSAPPLPLSGCSRRSVREEYIVIRFCRSSVNCDGLHVREEAQEVSRSVEEVPGKCLGTVSEVSTGSVWKCLGGV